MLWCLDRIVDHPFGCLTDVWQQPLPAGVAKIYIYASAHGPTKFVHYARAAEADPAWSYLELPGPHFLMFSHPDEVAAAILSAADPLPGSHH